MIAVPLSADIELRLEALAKTTGRPKTYYIEQAIIEYLDDMEDFFRADREVEELRTGRSTSEHLSVVMKHHGLED